MKRKLKQLNKNIQMKNKKVIYNNQVKNQI
jgi:hypothetical protein